MAPSTQTELKDLVIRNADGKTVTVPLNRDRISLGRSSVNELCYPDDSGLSRQHLAFTRANGDWFVEDLGSKNGTLLNGQRIDHRSSFRPGDRVTAGHLAIEFADHAPDLAHTVVFVDQADSFSGSTTTVVQNLDAVIAQQQQAAGDAMNRTQVMTGGAQMHALIRAGRELAGHRPLEELFPVILDLALEGVSAGRGVLLALENGELEMRAHRGEGFQISKTVRDRVLNEKASLLVRDAQLDQALKSHMSIVEQKVRSMMAVPLQTNDRVIGLIYVDSPNLIREFTREDLNLLTVMANVAAIRIEHARLSEIEEAERAMAKEMEQAAQIQKGLLPAKAPEVAGLDIAGRTTAAKIVGGDYFDFLTFPDGRVAMLVGDVAGKGMPASLLMSSLQARVQVLFEDADDLAKKVARLNRIICSNCPDNRFITFFMTIANPATGEFKYTNAGHNPPLIIRAGGGFEMLEGAGGIILGILPMTSYEEANAKLEAGDVLVLYSDGVTEAPNLKDDQFGEDRLAELVGRLKDRPAKEIADAVHQAVMDFAEGAPAADDITVVVVRRVN